MILVRDIIVEVRRVLQDESEEAPRNTNGSIRGSIRMALADVRRLRPDAMSASLHNRIDLQEETTLDIEEMFFSPIVHLSAAYVLLQNDELARDGLANNLISFGKQQLSSM